MVYIVCDILSYTFLPGILNLVYSDNSSASLATLGVGPDWRHSLTFAYCCCTLHSRDSTDIPSLSFTSYAT